MNVPSKSKLNLRSATVAIAILLPRHYILPNNECATVDPAYNNNDRKPCQVSRLGRQEHAEVKIEMVPTSWEAGGVIGEHRHRR